MVACLNVGRGYGSLEPPCMPQSAPWQSMDCMCTVPGTNNMPVGGHSKENLDFRSRCPWRNGSSSQICWGGQFQTSQVQFPMIFHIMSQRKTQYCFPAGKVPLINSQRLLVAARGCGLVSKRLWSLMGTSMTLGAPTALDQKNLSRISWGSWHFFITSARSGLLTLAHRRSSKGNPLWVCYLDIIIYPYWNWNSRKKWKLFVGY